MRLPALLFVTVLALLPAAAHAQVIIQDQAETFLDDRGRHQARMEQNPEKWWNGDVYDRASSTTLYDPHEFSDSPMLLNVPGATGQPTQAAATPIPGNPETVKPMFSFDEMNEAAREGETGTAPSEAPIDFSNPTDIENAIRRGIGAARGALAGGGTNPEDITQIPTGQDLPQPVPAQEAAPLRDRAVTLPAAAPYVPSDPKPAAINPPPVQDEAGATAINPNSAAPSADVPPAETTTTAIPALEDASATPADTPAADGTAADAPATSNRRAFGTAVAPGRDDEPAPGLTP